MLPRTQDAVKTASFRKRTQLPAFLLYTQVVASGTQSRFQGKIAEMGTEAAQKTYSVIRSRMSWPQAVAWGALAALVLFAIVNRKGCWLFRHDFRDLLDFVFVFAWLALFFAIRTRLRLLLLFVTILVILTDTRFGMVEMNAAAESSCVQALHQMQSSLGAYGVEHQQQGYPDVMPHVKLSSTAERLYRFEYVPNRSVSGASFKYLIQATPARRDCDFHRSFTIADDGRVFWTLEPRAAMPSDAILVE
jgi:hypothetical protein